jgi:hypothetical protein
MRHVIAVLRNTNLHAELLRLLYLALYGFA